jgi:hypothetical protein
MRFESLFLLRSVYKERNHIPEDERMFVLVVYNSRVIFFKGKEQK